ncbi:MAG: thrombospondin type 3 repeat-containing protein [bacterium]
MGDDCDRRPADADNDQRDSDGDGAGDACEQLPRAGINADQLDSDAITGDDCDNCPEVLNPGQE